MEIRRFGPGHRRPDGPPGTRGVTGQVIHQDGRGSIAEMAFAPGAVIAPHTNLNTSFFVVVSGGGFVQVGSERARVGHGEAVLWPAGELHGAWTEGTEMRALVIEFGGTGTGTDDVGGSGAGRAGAGLQQLDSREDRQVTGPGRARGSLAEPSGPPTGERGGPSGEPW
ncbi:MAG: cupin domain-containing protein [Candidatus Limnocylindrales bacterium]